jgi:hypothetical protein
LLWPPRIDQDAARDRSKLIVSVDGPLAMRRESRAGLAASGAINGSR